jgi:hypothetical protein
MVEMSMPGLYFVIANDARARFVRPDPSNHPHTVRELDALTLDGMPGGFARLLARSIIDEFAVDLFTHLVLVAPCHVLRDLIALIEGPVAECLIGSLTADLITVPDHELRPLLGEWLPELDD